MAADARQHWVPAYVGLGSNLRRPAQQLESAMDMLASIPQTRLIAKSSMYRSAPFGGIEQPDFINAAASLLTRLNAKDLLTELQAIEIRRGRERDDIRWGPRVLDLDLLVFSNQVIEESVIKVPHPGIVERNFVLLPLREIAPELVIPGLGRVNSLPVNRDEPHIEVVF